MLTALYEFVDEYGRTQQTNAKIGGYRTQDAAIKAILSKSPNQSGVIQQGLKAVAIVRNGRLQTL
jgi:hypothetical protein